MARLIAPSRSRLVWLGQPEPEAKKEDDPDWTRMEILTALGLVLSGAALVVYALK